MALTAEDIEQIKTLFNSELEPIKTLITDGDKGVASNITRKLNGEIEKISKTLEASKPSEDEKGDEKKTDETEKESPAVKALKAKLEKLENDLSAKDQAEAQRATRVQIAKELSIIPNINPNVVNDLTELLYNRWQGNLTEDQGSLFVNDKPVLDVAKEYLSSPSGSAFTIKKETNGNGLKPGTTENNGAPKSLESLLNEGLADLV